jgi:hypothetical protein
VLFLQLWHNQYRISYGNKNAVNGIEDYSILVILKRERSYVCNDSYYMMKLKANFPS